jgi:predicted GIY-YIG superfamily endonuclease
MGYVYLIHFKTRISPKHTCQHYLGYTKDSIKRRLEEHKAGKGARLTQVAVERGIDFEVVRAWKGSRALERKLKNRKNSRELCPVCRGAKSCSL